MLEEIAEAGAAEVELLRRAASAALAAGVGESAAALPIRAEMVVFPPFFRIAEHFVGFVDLLEFLLGGLFVLGDIRVVLAGEFAERLFDVVLAGIARDTEHGVVVFEFH